MNTAERRWVITAPAPTEADWDRLYFTLADFALEAIVETNTGAEIYFADEAEARACALAIGATNPPRLSGEGTAEVFGQSKHPTTELCISLMPAKPALRAADIGSGTGRLALHAIHHRAKLTIAVDPDWPAARATQRALLNTPHAYTAQASADALATATFDLILANLHLALWRELAPEIARIAAPRATLVASGFLESQQQDVEALMERHGWKIDTRRTREGWLAIRAARRT
jgi:ribosomal protein L11 methylase PrmA